MPIASAFLLCVVDRETGRQETGRKMRDRQGDGRQTGRRETGRETGKRQGDGIAGYGRQGEGRGRRETGRKETWRLGDRIVFSILGILEKVGGNLLDLRTDINVIDIMINKINNFIQIGKHN